MLYTLISSYIRYNEVMRHKIYRTMETRQRWASVKYKWTVRAGDACLIERCSDYKFYPVVSRRTVVQRG